MMKYLLLFIIIFLFYGHISAQTYNMSNGATISTCSGTFYDNGGLGNYSNNANQTMTFCNTTPGQPIYITFSSFTLENFFDYLYIYNGPTTGSPLIGSYTNTANPGTVVGTTGCITFNFTSDGSVTYAGWVATISCTPPPPQPCSFTPIPLCGPMTTPFAGSTTSVGSFGCLGAIYNPTYYLIQPTTTGSLTVTISSGCDVDFALWGPFASPPCNMPTTGTIDCSFSTAATEFADIASTVPGQYYLLLVSNYCNVNTNINLTPTGTAAAGLACGCGIGASATSGIIACNGGTTSITVTGTGVASYNYSISPNVGTLAGNVFSNVPAGTYTITVTNAANASCSTTTSITVSQPAVLSASNSATAIACFGGTSTITASANGGTPAYQYSLNGGAFQAGNTFIVTAGTYTITVKDANGCQVSNPITITQPATTVTASASSTPIACNGGTSTVTISASNGTPNYLYSLNGSAFQASNTFTIGAGTYNYSVTDANGCVVNGNITIGEPTAVAVLANQSAPILCNGGMTDLQGSASGGTPNYTYTWNTAPPQYTQNATNVPAGTYTLTVADLNACTNNASVTITEPTVLALSSTAQTPTSCNGGSDGTATVNVAGGTPNYSYSWDCVPSQNTAIATNLLAGTYTCYISDGNSCTTTASVTVLEPTVVDVTAAQTATACNGGTSTIALTATGGMGGYQYSVDGGATYQASNTFSLVAGLYNIMVIDANNCTDTTSIQVSVNSLPTPTITATATAICAGASTTMDAGTGYSAYSWYAAPATPLGTNQFETTSLPNTYGVVVTDANNCQGTDTITINLNATPVITIVANGATTFCPGDSVDLDAGAGLTTYSWSSNPAGATGNGQILTANSTGIYMATVTNVFGCVGSDTISVTVQDLIAPVITNCPANITQNNDVGICGAVVNWTPLVVTDNCTFNLVQTAGLANGGVFPIGTTNVDYLVTDAGGNTATCSFTITISDTENPIINACPANIVVTNDIGICGAAVNWIAPTVSDNCPSAVINQTQGLSGGSVFPLGTTTIEYTATDAAGNTAICTFTITVSDTELPVILGCPANINVSNDVGICGAVINWITPTVSDNCPNPILTQIAGLANGAVFPVGTTTVSYEAQDANGNKDTCTFTVTVSDTENPVIANCPTNIALPSDLGQCGAIATWVLPTESDNCPGVVMVQTQGLANGALFPLGTTTVEYTATDAAGNTAICTFTVTVTDTISPVFTACPANFVLNNDMGFCGAVATWTTPTANDNCPNVVVVQTLGLTSGSLFPIGTSTVQYVATDGAGNTDTCQFTVTVSDAELPTLANCPANIAVSNDLGQCSAVVNWTAPTPADNCPGVVMASNFNSGDIFPLGNTVVTYTATDVAGNAVSCSFTITVTDDENPVLSNCPANQTLSAGANCSIAANWVVPTLADNCPGVGMTSNFNSGDIFGLGTTMVTYIATDAAGNTDTCSFTITVQDNTPPVILNCPANISQNAGPNCDAIVNWVAPTVSDNCPNVVMTSNFNPGNTFPFTTTVVTYTATDAAGNITTCSFNVDLFDNTPPIVNNCPANIVVNLEARCDTILNWIPPTITDNCSGLVITSTHNPGEIFSIGVTNVNYTGTDAAGNVATCNFTITVIAPPAISATISAATNPNCNGQKGSATVNATGGSGAYNLSWTSVPSQNTSTAALGAGNYVVFVADALAGTCVLFDTAQVTITEPTALQLNITHNNLKCFADNSGDATANVLGGTLPYTYSWDNNALTALNNNLAAGNYNVFVTDAQGCTKTALVTLTQPDSLSAIVSQIDIKCFGDNTGKASIAVGGGTSPYNYVWTNGVSTTGTANNMLAGTYTVTITDVNLCTINRTFVITQPASPLTLATSHTDAACFGTKTGDATVTASGGTPAYTYTWNSAPLQFTPMATNLGAGTRTITVKDANLCTATTTVAIGQPTEIKAVIQNVVEPFCNKPNGAISASAGGGSSPYTYIWNTTPPQTTQIANALLEGNYTVIATDAQNCHDTITATLTNTPPPVALFTTNPDNSEPILLQDATIEFTNLSTGAVAYEWNFGDGINDNRTNTEHTYQEPGFYIVTLTAFNAYYQACPDTQSITFEIKPDGTIFIPNVFTPNFDGSNDEFFIGGTGIKEMRCTIFDRWGKIVYILQSPGDRWKGKNQEGKDLPEGTYTFKIDATLNDGTPVEKGGTVMLIR